MPKLKPGITGRSRTDGDKPGFDGPRELPTNPKRPGPTFSSPGPGNGSGTVPLGKKITPKHKGGEYS